MTLHPRPLSILLATTLLAAVASVSALLSPIRSAESFGEKLLFPLTHETIAADNNVIRSARRLETTHGFSKYIWCAQHRCRISISQGYTLRVQPREAVSISVEAILSPYFKDLGSMWLDGRRPSWDADNWRWTVSLHRPGAPPVGYQTTGTFEDLSKIPKVDDLPALSEILVALHRQVLKRNEELNAEN